MDSNLKTKILELRSQGHTYNHIKRTLGCSKGTIAFHCGEGQKEKSRRRTMKRRGENPLLSKLNSFFYGRRSTVVNEHYEKSQEATDKKLILKIRTKMNRFFRNKDRKTYGEYMFSAKELLDKIGPNPTCYLTGEPIDLNKSRSYHLDHIVPKSRGGDDSLDNCQIASREANQAKGDLLLEEFVALCQKVIEHNEKK